MIAGNENMSDQSELGIFRSILPMFASTDGLVVPDNCKRYPQNISFVIDNLWEWKRPLHFPNRRYSVFASPQKKTAITNGPPGGILYRVQIIGDAKLCQLKGWSDSKYHPEIKELRNFLLNKLGDNWLNSTLSEKEDIGKLWIPCLSKDEVEAVFNSVKELREIRDVVYSVINYWNDVVLIDNINQIAPSGELFFEAKEGYFLAKERMENSNE